MTKLTAEYPTVEERHQAAIVAKASNPNSGKPGTLTVAKVPSFVSFKGVRDYPTS